MSPNPKRVAVFDDDEDLLIIFRFLFEERGWEVSTFPNCDEIEQKVTAVAPDLILMDNWIPSTGGERAVRTLKENEQLKNIPVIYISANNEVKEIAAKAGADSFSAKPFDFEELFNQAQSLLNKTTS